jgi:hypothetical protein
MSIENRVLGISRGCDRHTGGAGDTPSIIVVEGEFDHFATSEAHPQKMDHRPKDVGAHAEV